MKRSIITFILLLSPLFLYAQNNSSIDGTWEGSIILQGQPLIISVTFNTMDGDTDGSINIPQQSAFNLPVVVPVLTSDSLKFSFETGTGTAVFSAGLKSPELNKINGVFTQSGVELPFQMIKSDNEGEARADYFSEENIVIETDSVTIAGSLVVPDSVQSESLVIFISGSGSQTRNGSVAGFEIFKELTDQLAVQGISSFRYDDRGTGQSTGSGDATIEQLAGDLAAIAKNLSRDNISAFENIAYLGHSQGGLVSLIAAEEFTPKKMVLLATPMLPGDEIITQQIRHISEQQRIPDDVLARNMGFQKKVFEAARTGEGWAALETELEERLREQLNELPEKQLSTLGNMEQFIQTQVSRQLGGAKSSWFRSFIVTDPRSYIPSEDVPVLALFGENDSQVLPSPNRSALEQIDGNFIISTVPKANHLFQMSESGMPGEYGILDKTFAPGLVTQIADFLKQSE